MNELGVASARPASPLARLVLRRAGPADVDAIFALKQRLQLTPVAGSTTRGGFLLGVSRGRYDELVAHANVLVLESGRVLQGFAITLPDRVLRASALWARRDAIAWAAGVPAIADEVPVGYFDQIACVPGWASRLGAPALALRALLELLAAGHRHVFATVVRAPVHNLAALRMLAAIGARHVGQLRESHDELPELRSDVYHLDCSGTSRETPWEDTALGRRIVRTIAQLSAS